MSKKDHGPAVDAYVKAAHSHGHARMTGTDDAAFARAVQEVMDRTGYDPAAASLVVQREAGEF